MDVVHLRGSDAETWPFLASALTNNQKFVSSYSEVSDEDARLAIETYVRTSRLAPATALFVITWPMGFTALVGVRKGTDATA